MFELIKQGRKKKRGDEQKKNLFKLFKLLKRQGPVAMWEVGKGGVAGRHFFWKKISATQLLLLQVLHALNSEPFPTNAEAEAKAKAPNYS